MTTQRFEQISEVIREAMAKDMAAWKASGNEFDPNAGIEQFPEDFEREAAASLGGEYYEYVQIMYHSHPSEEGLYFAENYNSGDQTITRWER